MVLYRKYRPQKFADIVGQEHVVRTLSNALATLKFGHAYLFAGPKGSGKTTMARILAKALNCTGRKLSKDLPAGRQGSYEPCNKCSSCKEISAGKSLDLIEIDAASNRGIDEIRDLREKIRFAPTSSQYKIYIIDEVHMLTKEAFNALLKTLEEPPKHAIFIMATTEPQKVLPTILSRVQRFDFHRASLEEISKLLERVSKQEAIKIDEDALHLLGQLSFGSYRDALSLLEQVSSLRQTTASKITLLQVQEVLGIAQEKSIFEFIRFLLESDRRKALELISKLYYQGVDLENFTQKLIEILRKMALYKIGEDQLFDLTKEQQVEVKELAEKSQIDGFMNLITKFINILPQIKSANLPPLPIEMAVFEITAADREMQNVCGPNLPAIAGMQIQNDNVKLQNEIKPVISEIPKPASKKQFSSDLWPQIVKEARTRNHSLAALLRDAAIADQKENTITLAFKFKFHADTMAGKKYIHVIEELIAKITGTQYKIVCIVNPALVIQKPLDPDEELLNGAKEVFEVEE